MSDIEVKSRWINRHNSDVVMVTGLLDDLVLFDYCNNAAKKSGSLSVGYFLKVFKLLNDAPATQADMVNHPPHYKDASGIECIEVTKHMQFCGGNCFKYLYRAGKKGSTIEDLKKAKWYAERAWIMNEVVSDEVINKITDIASFRLVGIADVMTAISESDWYKAGFAINAEIARLESE